MKASSIRVNIVCAIVNNKHRICKTKVWVSCSFNICLENAIKFKCSYPIHHSLTENIVTEIKQNVCHAQWYIFLLACIPFWSIWYVHKLCQTNCSTNYCVTRISNYNWFVSAYHRDLFMTEDLAVYQLSPEQTTSTETVYCTSSQLWIYCECLDI